MKSIRLTALLLLFNLGVHAQQTLVASGGKATGTEGSSSYTVGQIVYATQTGTNGNSIREGIQQPYEISVVLGVAEAKDISLELKAYPNPTKDDLIVKVKNQKGKNLHFQLYNEIGELLQNVKANGTSETVINMNRYTQAIYFLKVLEEEKEIKVFKIIKK